MSTDEYERFVADLRSNEALRAEAAESALASLVAFAVSKGYGVTSAQVRERSAAVGKALSDAELAGVSGGGSFIVALPEVLEAAAGDLQSIGSAIKPLIAKPADAG